ncbi:hypothetical protein EDC18_10751 [Natranaerovirga pectinivora]|uniref:Uncharacterized protein n=1 Tax=Natranaerovirga pectinivora TaxID=682400 RepID=A0A4R3MN13_9FIRM|nr:hypothetical protein [Natranaerovirga pectinivora]TCT13982.1 hypothetical protein EDC18_10751 [Natranaerovirga pectinivora]
MKKKSYVISFLIIIFAFNSLSLRTYSYQHIEPELTYDSALGFLDRNGNILRFRWDRFDVYKNKTLTHSYNTGLGNVNGYFFQSTTLYKEFDNGNLGIVSLWTDFDYQFHRYYYTLFRWDEPTQQYILISNTVLKNTTIARADITPYGFALYNSAFYGLGGTVYVFNGTGYTATDYSEIPWNAYETFVGSNGVVYSVSHFSQEVFTFNSPSSGLSATGYTTATFPNWRVLIRDYTLRLANGNIRRWHYSRDFNGIPYYSNTRGVVYYPTNLPPELSTVSPIENSVYVDYEGMSEIIIEGHIRDFDNDKITVTATIGDVSKSLDIDDTLTHKFFSVTFDVIDDFLPLGVQNIEIIANDNRGGIAKKEIPINIKTRLTENTYILVDNIIYYTTSYEDYENDPLYKNQYRFIHNPYYFDNNLGFIENTGIWIDEPFNSFSKTGNYIISYRAKDIPRNVGGFEDYRLWSKENLTQINVFVHRKPIPVAMISTSYRNSSTRFIHVTEASYDLDHQEKLGKGISDRQWQWRNINDSTWINGELPSFLSIDQEYIARLRVRDIDGPSGLGVWSEWLEIPFDTTGQRVQPIALFTLTPKKVSHSEIITATDLSYSPSGHLITEREWVIKRKNGTILQTLSTTPTSNQLKQGGLGEYTLQLRVRDAIGWSETYQLEYAVMNNPPLADFEIPEEVYRDTIIKPINKSFDPDNDNITYRWYLILDNEEYFISNQKEPNFNIQQIINSHTIPPIKAIDEWDVRLRVTDSFGASSTSIQSINVLNQEPIASMNGPITANQYTQATYTSTSIDPDTADNPLTQYLFRHTFPNGKIINHTGSSYIANFDLEGEHLIEHWVVDQIGAESQRVFKTVEVVENQAPNMIITNPIGTETSPSIIVTNQLDLNWLYTDLEEDQQEKYSFDFYIANGNLLHYTISADDLAGNIRSHLFNKSLFEEYVSYRVLGRTFSMYKWSEPSNEVYFMFAPFEIQANLRTQDNRFSVNSIPASEGLLVTDIKTKFPLAHHLEMAIYNNSGTRLTPIKTVSNSQAIRNNNDWTWNNQTYTIPATLADGNYKFRVYARNSTNPSYVTYTEFDITVNTPINLVSTIRDTYQLDEPMVFTATTSKYATSNTVNLYQGTEYQITRNMTLVNQVNEINYWSYIHNETRDVPDGTYTARFTATTPSGKSQVVNDEYNLVSLNILEFTIRGAWNHWRGQVNIHGNQLRNMPHRFMSYEKVYINAIIQGNPDEVYIRFSPELESMVFTDPNGHIYYYQNHIGYTVDFPIHMISSDELHYEVEYILPLANSTMDYNDYTLRGKYWVELTAIKGSTVRKIRIDDIDITGNTLDRIYMQQE